MLASVQYQNQELPITGDFNFHMNKPEDPKTRRFQDIFDTFDLVRHVKHGTHECTVQRRATKVINGFRDLSYQQRITRLNLPTLEFRRKKRVEMMEVFKITHNIYDAECCPKSKLSNRVGRSHSLKLFRPQVNRLDLQKYSFPVTSYTPGTICRKQ